MNKIPLHLCLLLPTLLCTALCAADKKTPQPNIVVFISDDHSMLDSQAYGSTEVRTPTYGETSPPMA
jgi:hypothetical protein